VDDGNMHRLMDTHELFIHGSVMQPAWQQHHKLISRQPRGWMNCKINFAVQPTRRYAASGPIIEWLHRSICFSWAQSGLFLAVQLGEILSADVTFFKTILLSYEQYISDELIAGLFYFHSLKDHGWIY
jgi:hypothetical protein